MGLIDTIFRLVFGQGDSIAHTLRELRPLAPPGQGGQVIGPGVGGGRYDRFMDAVNRIPRPAMALMAMMLLLAALVAPAWFTHRMTALDAVPEPMWWLLGVVVSFYFGGRHQIKTQAFQATMANRVLASQRTEIVPAPDPGGQSPGGAGTGTDCLLRSAALEQGDNPALAAWQKSLRGAATM
jgi:hypothetical protein